MHTLSSEQVSNFRRIFFLLLILAQFLPINSWADLSDLKVYSPIVEKGKMGIEVLGNKTVDDDAEHDDFQYHELEFEYGVTDWWATSITASLIKPAEESLKYNILGWENTFQFTEQGKYWLDFGVHFELEFDDENDEPNIFEMRVLFEKTLPEYQHTFNVNFEQQFGSAADESTELEYIWRSRKEITEHISIGFEAYGSLGEIKDFAPLQEQEHIIGPAIYNEFHVGPIEIEAHLVWMFGLTEVSADHTFRWQLEFPFN